MPAIASLLNVPPFRRYFTFTMVISNLSVFLFTKQGSLVFPRSLWLFHMTSTRHITTPRHVWMHQLLFSFSEIKLRCSHMGHLLQRLSEGWYTHLCPFLPTKHKDSSLVLAHAAKKPVTLAFIRTKPKWPLDLTCYPKTIMYALLLLLL